MFGYACECGHSRCKLTVELEHQTYLRRALHGAVTSPDCAHAQRERPLRIRRPKEEVVPRGQGAPETPEEWAQRIYAELGNADLSQVGVALDSMGLAA